MSTDSFTAKGSLMGKTSRDYRVEFSKMGKYTKQYVLIHQKGEIVIMQEKEQENPEMMNDKEWDLIHKWKD